jgi:MFS transporter, DHA1 family, multidrug resistance protein
LRAVLSTRRLTLLVASMTAIGPFSIDTYLPAFGAIGASLDASPVAVQQTLSIYMLCFGLMNLWHGAISDSLGRRRVLLAAFLVFALACAGASVASSIEQLWFWRAIQGLAGGAGMTVGRAVVRDRVSGSDAQRILAHAMMIFALAPAIAPIIGGYIAHGFGWRAIFVFLTAVALAIWLAIWRLLPETLDPAARQSLAPAHLLRGYAGFFGSGDFWRLTGSLSFNFQGLFVLIMAAPVLLPQHLGLGPTQFGWLFVPVTTGGLIGGYFASRLAGRKPVDWCIRSGYAIMAAGAALSVAVNLGETPPLWQVIPPYMVYTTGMGLALSSLQVRLLDLSPLRAGMVSSCQAFVQSLANAATAAFLAPLLWDSPLKLAIGMAVLMTAGVALYAWHVALRGPAAFSPSGKTGPPR